MTNDRDKFQGRVEADLSNIKSTLDVIAAAIEEIRKDETNIKVCLAKVRAQVRILWAGAGVLAVAILGLALRSF